MDRLCSWRMELPLTSITHQKVFNLLSSCWKSTYFLKACGTTLLNMLLLLHFWLSGICRHVWTRYPAGGAVRGRIHCLYSACSSGVTAQHLPGHPDEWYRPAHGYSYWSRNHQCSGAVHKQGTHQRFVYDKFTYIQMWVWRFCCPC